MRLFCCLECSEFSTLYRYAEKHIYVFLYICIFSFIPAHAGTIRCGSTASGLRGAHPHSRGEHIALRGLKGSPPGSSPHTRGTSGVGCVAVRHVRLIPTRAGKTQSGTAAATGAQAHSRTRGDHGPLADSPIRGCGSSPLARGPYPPGR